MNVGYVSVNRSSSVPASGGAQSLLKKVGLKPAAAANPVPDNHTPVGANLLHPPSFKTKSKEEAYVLWPELQVLLSLPQIKELGCESIRKIICGIHRGNFYQLQEITHLLLKEKVCEIDRQLETTPYFSLDTMLDEAIKGKPKNDAGILNYWNEPSSFFINKILSVTDSSTQRTHSGKVVHCVFKKKQKIFHLSDGFEVRVSDNLLVELVNKTLNFTLAAPISGSTPDNIYPRILVKQEPGEPKEPLAKFDQAKSQSTILQWSQIKKQREAICNELLLPENQSFLSSLLDDLVLNKLQKINMSALACTLPGLVQKLKALSQSYQDYLQIDLKAEDLLKKAVEEANYVQFVGKKDNEIVVRTMKLMKDAGRHLAKIEGKKALFFLGETGAGKSTAISYFLGASLEIFLNHVGDWAVRLKAQISGGAAYPKIGQSLGESETLYAQGYELSEMTEFPNRDVVLVDCPGSHETRGSDYELCTHLSIDLAFQKAERIHALVVVLPIQAFLSDRSEYLIHLAEMVQERFPGTFDPDRLENHAHVYFLITKDLQAQPETIVKLRDGTRIKELFKIAQDKLQTLKEQHQQGASMGFEWDHAHRKYRIWQVIQHMYSNNQIDILNLTNRLERKRLLVKYSGSYPPFEKSNYVPGMQGEEMQRKFGDYIRSAMEIWTNQIFAPYLETIPKAIKCEKDPNQCQILQKTKRNLALIIYSQQDIAAQVKEFSQHIVKADGQGKFHDVFVACSKFLKTYDTHMTKILEDCRKDLAL